MSHDHDINSRAYWDNRFSGDWESCDGPHQSKFFSTLGLEHLPLWFLEAVRRERLSVVDWGCAQGDGTAPWAAYVAPDRLTGVDLSPVAIEQARARYPGIRFLAEDWLTPAAAEAERFDVLFSSNTLEHFARPSDILAAIAPRVTKAIVLVLPFREQHRHPEHLVSFDADTVPVRLPTGLTLLWSRVIDCSSRANTPWLGEQIVLVYADPAWSESLAPNLAQVEVQSTVTLTERAYFGHQLERLRERLDERERELAVATDRGARAVERVDVLEPRIQHLEQRHASKVSTRLYRWGRRVWTKLSSG